MTNSRQALGRWGEETAAAYLHSKGFEVLARNARTPYGEIDLVARRDGVTLFVEVKTRSSDKLGNPEESVNARKQEHMLAAAEHYAAEHAIDNWQIDVIAITGRPGWKHSLRHFENALG
jgi:putative endonuclease